VPSSFETTRRHRSIALYLGHGLAWRQRGCTSSLEAYPLFPPPAIRRAGRHWRFVGEAPKEGCIANAEEEVAVRLKVQWGTGQETVALQLTWPGLVRLQTRKSARGGGHAGDKLVGRRN